MAITDLCTLCVMDLQSKIETVPAFKNKVFYIYTQDDMMDKSMQLSMPCAGVMYEGLRSVPDADDRTAKGLSTVFQASIILLVSGKSIGNADYKIPAVNLLDQFRNAIKLTRSPAGQFWKFMLETAVEPQHDGYTYIQRWSTPVILTS